MIKHKFPQNDCAPKSAPRHNKLRRANLAAAFSLLLLTTHAQAAPVGELLGFFSSSCPSQGSFSKNAIDTARNLASAIESMANDPDCATAAASMTALPSIQNTLAEIATYNRSQVYIQQQRASQQEIELELISTTDPTERASLLAQLRALSSSVATTQLGLPTEDQIKLQKYSALMGGLIGQTNALLKQSVANQRCLFKKPSLFTDIAALGGNVAALSTMSNPALSMGLAAGSQLLSSIVEFGRQMRIERKVRKIQEGITAPAFQCVLENMTGQFCRARDALKVIHLLQDADAQPRIGGDLVIVARLVDHEAQVLIDWVNSLKAASDPANPADAERLQNLFYREASVRSVQAIGIGRIQEARTQFAAIPSNDPEKIKRQWQIERTLILNLMDQIYNNTGTDACSGHGPLAELIPCISAPYYVMGLEKSQYPNEGGQASGKTLPFSQFDLEKNLPGFIPDLNILEARFRAWIDDAFQVVNAELARMLQPNALGVLNTALYENNEQRVGAYTSTKILIDALTRFKPKKFQSAGFARVFEETAKNIAEIERLIRESILENKIPPEVALREITNVTGLIKNGSAVVLKGNLDLSLRVSLLDLIEHSPQIDQDTAMQFLVSRDIFDALKSIDPNRDRASMIHDITKSITITDGTLSHFVDVFARSIRKALRYLKAQEGLQNDATSRYYRDERTELCLKLLAVRDRPRNRRLPIELCEGLKFEAAATGGPQSILITPETWDLPQEERMCAFQDYFRKSKIYEERRILFP